jgi:nitrogen fixation protein NifU and related proteins
MSGGIDDLYRQVILDHYQHPRNVGRLDAPDVAARGTNPLCGDEVEVALAIHDGRIAAVAFQGRGCSISQASASLMTERIKGQTVAEVAATIGRFRTMMSDPDVPELAADALGDLAALQGVRGYRVRVKCALLAWNALQDGLEQYVAGADTP